MADKKNALLKKTFLIIGFFILWFGLSWVTKSLCWFQSVMGLPCPGCGSTRAALELLRGNIADALTLHPLIFVSLILMGYAAVRGIFFFKKPMLNIEKYILLGVLSLYLIVFIFRMFLFFPHTQPLVPNEDALWRQAVRMVL